MLKLLLKQFPGIQIDLIFGNRWGAEKVLEHSELKCNFVWIQVDETVLSKAMRLLSLRKKKYDHVLCPFDSSPVWFLASLCLFTKSDKTIHLPPSQGSLSSRIFWLILRNLLSNSRFVPVLQKRSESLLNIDLLTDIIDEPVCGFDLLTTVGYVNEDIRDLIRGKRYIVIQPFARNGMETPKSWSPANFLSLIDEYQKKIPNIRIVLVGDKGDFNHCVASGIGSLKNVTNLIGETNFNQLCSVLKQAQLVIAHDSGVMHVANALQVPLLALYGPTDYHRTRPMAPTSEVLHSKNESWGEMRGFKISEDELTRKYPPYYCMSSISVEQVLSKSLAMINSTAASGNRLK